MNKIKMFRFEVSNATSSPLSDDEKESWYKNTKRRLVSEETIEKTLNDFLRDKTLIDIKINTVDVNYHNNGRGNTIHLVYNIIYTE